MKTITLGVPIEATVEVNFIGDRKLITVRLPGDDAKDAACVDILSDVYVSEEDSED